MKVNLIFFFIKGSKNMIEIKYWYCFFLVLKLKKKKL